MCAYGGDAAGSEVTVLGRSTRLWARPVKFQEMTRNGLSRSSEIPEYCALSCSDKVKNAVTRKVYRKKILVPLKAHAWFVRLDYRPLQLL